jgi:very-short-patch-repair endonuclease
MGGQIQQRGRNGAAWALAARQHDVVTRAQLLSLGYSRHAIDHRLATGRLFPIWRGVYSAGRPQPTRLGLFMAAVLSCGPHAVLSHESAAELWEIARRRPAVFHVSVPTGHDRVRHGIRVHRRPHLVEVTHRHRIPVTTPIATIVDLTPGRPRAEVEAIVNEATIRRLTDPDRVRAALDSMPRRPGIAALRMLLDRRTFRFTRSELERHFLRLVKRAGLPMPLTCHRVNGHEVDFYWPELGLVVECDSLTFHRTAERQENDARRDQDHLASGLVPLRFTHGQIKFEPARVVETLAAVAHRLKSAALR